DPATGRLYVGNNALLAILGANLFSFDQAGQRVWRRSQTNGSGAAAPPPAAGGAGVARGLGRPRGAVGRQTKRGRWAVRAPEPGYGSAAEQPDGPIGVPSADGTIYALAPTTGAKKWAFDTLEPIRSSPAIDADGNVYVGSGEGRLFVLNRDGTLRWAMRLI